MMAMKLATCVLYIASKTGLLTHGMVDQGGSHGCDGHVNEASTDPIQVQNQHDGVLCHLVEPDEIVHNQTGHDNSSRIAVGDEDPQEAVDVAHCPDQLLVAVPTAFHATMEVAFAVYLRAKLTVEQLKLFVQPHTEDVGIGLSQSPCHWEVYVYDQVGHFDKSCIWSVGRERCQDDVKEVREVQAIYCSKNVGNPANPSYCDIESDLPADIPCTKGKSLRVQALPGEEVSRQAVVAVAGLVTGGGIQRAAQHPVYRENLHEEEGT